MKKIFCIILAMTLIIGVSISTYALEPDKYAITATVVTCIYDEATERYAFCAVADFYGNTNQEPFTFGLPREKILSNEFDEEDIVKLETGQIITVVYNGEVMESYPMQIVPYYISVEEEIQELTDDEKLGYLTMFYTEQWLIDNGYMEVPLTDGEPIPPVDCDEDTSLPADSDGWIDVNITGPDDSEGSYICGVPLEDDEDGKCVTLSEYYLEGFVVGISHFTHGYDPTSSEPYDSGVGATIYFLAYSNFGDEMITPIMLTVTESEVGLLNGELMDIKEGSLLRIYCEYGSYCISSIDEKYLELDGKVLTIEILDGYKENYKDYSSEFWNVENEYSDDEYVGIIEMPVEDVTVATELPLLITDEAGESEIATQDIATTDNSSNAVVQILALSAIIIISVTATIVLLKKK